MKNTIHFNKWHMRAATAALGLITAGAVSGMEIDSGNPDIKIRWDNTLKYSGAFRLKNASSALTNAGPNGSFTANQNDGDNNFGRGLVSNRFDVLSEFDVKIENLGARVSAATWYDTVYNRKNDNTSTTANHTPKDEFPSETRELMGRGAEVLDAFIFGKGEVGDHGFSWRAGRHTLLWGESLFFGSNGIAGGQAPLDLIRLQSVPNSTFKEVARPSGKLSGQFQVSDTVSVGAYYQYEWVPTRLMPVGAYLSTSDSLGPGTERINAGPLGAFLEGRDIKPSNGNQYGLQLKVRAPSIDTDFGFYALRYNATGPSNIYSTLTGIPNTPSFKASSYQWAYHEGIRAFGMSASTSVSNWNIAGEISYRQNAPLSSSGQTVLPTINVNTTFNNTDNPGYAVGETAHAQFSWLASLEPSFISDEASFIGEVAWNTRVAVSRNKEMLNPNADKSATAMRMVYSPTYRQILPGIDISLPVGLGYTWGRSSALGPSFGPNHGGDFNIGISGTYRGGWTAGLSYVQFIGHEGPTLDEKNNAQFKQALKDRQYISFSIRNTF